MKKSASGSLEIRELTPELWPAFEKLFGPNGACAGCWCMWWRIPEGERFKDVRGAEAKRRQRKLVLAGKSRGLLAFADGEPVGWCAYGRRTEFGALARSRTLACDDAEQWGKYGEGGRGICLGVAVLNEAPPVTSTRLSCQFMLSS